MSKIYKFPKGVTITAPNAWAAALVSLTFNDVVTSETEDTDLTDEYMRTLDNGLRDGGELTFTVRYDPDSPPPFGGDDGTWTITMPLLSGESTAGSQTFTGHVTKHGGPEFQTGDNRITSEITVKVNSARAFVAGS